MSEISRAGRARVLMLEKRFYDEIIAHCRRQYPKEACGILAGHDDVVKQVYPMTKVEDSPIGYSMDPREQLRVEKAMRQRGQRMVGIYHSHTASEAYPSSVDVSLAISPEISYVLVSLMRKDDPVLKSYRIDGKSVIPEEWRMESASGRVGAG